VLDLRAGYRIRRDLVLAAVLENVGDAAYRWHGSSVNGAGRGLLVSVEAGL
jgi:outer membrane receptor protein involved in Fe transport